MIRVYLAGEGRHELGGWADERPYRRPEDRGVLVALAQKVRPDGWAVVAARKWKDVPKYRAGDHRRPEARTVLGLAALAAHEGCSVLVFARDRDRMVGREDEIEQAMNQIQDLRVAGAVAVRTLDAWCLALTGQRDTEHLRRPKDACAERGVVTTEDRVAVADAADLNAVPEDAESLRRWLQLLARAFAS